MYERVSIRVRVSSSWGDMTLYYRDLVCLACLILGAGRYFNDLYITFRQSQFPFMFVVSSANAYRPVVVMHGILSSYDYMTDMVQFIQKAHPGTEVLNVNAYNYAVSASIYGNIITCSLMLAIIFYRRAYCPCGTKWTVCKLKFSLLWRVLQMEYIWSATHKVTDLRSVTLACGFS